jgi:hypothetical protein
MSETLKFGNGQWATKVGSTLAYNDEGGNFKPLPFNFTRSTSATRVNKDGLIEVVTNNKPRIDFLNDSNGALLLEPQRSNLALYSNDLSNAAWDKSYSTITSNAAISPDGTTNANKVVETTDTGLHRAGQGAIAVTSGQVYTFSFYAKAAERNELELQRINTSGTVFNNISVTTADLILGTLSVGLNVTSSSINSVGDGWYRISLSLTAIATGSGGLNIGMQKDGNVSYLGDGTSGVYIYGFQAEQGSYATSYIPTQGATATRVAETCEQKNLLTDIINASYPFTMYVDGKYNGQLSPLLSFLNIDASQQFFLIYIFNNEVLFSARSNGTIEIIESNINLVDGQEFKIAVTMENSTSGKICVNGNSVTVKNNFSSQIQNSNITDLLIGQERVVSDGGVRSSVSGVKLYNEALTDQELINLTKI